MECVNPLQWPDGWPRIPLQERRLSRFRITLFVSIRTLARELKLFGADGATLSTNVALDVASSDIAFDDPLLSMALLADQGAALKFKLDGREYHLACDEFALLADNMAALCNTVRHLRDIARWNVPNITARLLSAFVTNPYEANHESTT